MAYSRRLLLLLPVLIWGGLASALTIDVRDKGALGDGESMDTKAIQAALDACAKAGGGRVILSTGRYLTGTLELRSHVELHLEAGAVLLASTDLADYPEHRPAFRSYTDNYTNKSILYGEQLEGVILSGQGVIDGQGVAFKGDYKKRPFMARFIECKGLCVEDLTFQHGAMWTLHTLACEDVVLRDLAIFSKQNKNNDGLDIDCCSNVRVSGCHIVTQDDAIVLKSTAARFCENVTVTNCVLSSISNALKMGTESTGGFRNIAISNCVVYETLLAGLALEIVDGGRMEDIVVSNLSMRDVAAPIFIRLGNRARCYTEGQEKPGVGVLRNVSINNIQASECGPTGCALSGIPGFKIENVVLSAIRLGFVGGGKAGFVRTKVPEKEAEYPEYKMFGRLPAYGLYCRHMRNLTLRDVSVWTHEGDSRPALICDDVEGLKISNFAGTAHKKQDALMEFRSVSNALITQCMPTVATPAFLSLQGSANKDIVLTGNLFRGVGEIIRADRDSPKGACVLAEDNF